MVCSLPAGSRTTPHRDDVHRNFIVRLQLRVSLEHMISRMCCLPATSQDRAWRLQQACAQAVCCSGARRQGKQGSASTHMVRGLPLQACTMARCSCLVLVQSHLRSSTTNLCLRGGMGAISVRL